MTEIKLETAFLSEIIRDTLILIDRETRKIIDVNEAACILYGYSKNELLNLTDIDLSSQVKETTDGMANVPSNVIRLHKKKDGTVFPAEITSSAHTINNKDVVLDLIRDITDREVLKNQVEYERDKARIYFNIANIIFLVLDKKGIVTEINKKGCEILECEHEDILGQNWVDSFLPQNNIKTVVMNIFNRIISEEINGVEFFENTIITKSGNEKTISWNSNIIKDELGNVIGVLNAGNDITNRKLVEDSLKKSELRLREAQALAQIGNWELNLQDKTVWASEQAYKIYGLDYASKNISLDIVQKSVLEEYREYMDEALVNLIGKNEKYDVRYIIKDRKTGKHKFIHSIAEQIVDETGNAIKIAGTIQDITEQKKIEDKFHYMSYHDHLTGLYNRRYFQEELTRIDVEKNLPLSVIIIDVNGLKVINDSFGQVIGDSFLIKTADVLKNGCRTSDIVCRLGGDEFVILLPKTDSAEALKIANKLKEQNLNEKLENIELSLSYGYSTKTKKEESINDVLANAENYMYRHKLYERSSMRSNTIDIIMNTLFEKSSRESQHSKRVSKICELIALKMNFNKEHIDKIRTAGLIHDIGKIGIDEKILNKTDKLDDNEWHDMKKHPESGWRILSSSNEFSELAQFVLNHQEKWDGSGYPNGLKEDEIPIEARIISVADSYDAMTSKRTYKEGISKDAAVEELLRCSGSHFDPSVVDIFVNKVLSDSNKFL